MLASCASPGAPADGGAATVVEVVDGDTIVARFGDRSDTVRLIGIDTPSMDPMKSKTLDAHKALFEGDVAILESVDLSGVAEGRYELVALPLKISGADSSPVRAILRTLDHSSPWRFCPSTTSPTVWWRRILPTA